MSLLDPEKLEFTELYSSLEIEKRIVQMGNNISHDCHGEPLVVIGILKGAFIFMADLVRQIKAPLTVDFMGCASYLGTSSTGTVRITHDLSTDIAGKHVLLVEDIVDTGRTLDYLLRILAQRQPKSIRVCALLDKPAAREVSVQVHYTGFKIEKDFVIGYGLDYEQRFRELPFIAKVKL